MRGLADLKGWLREGEESRRHFAAPLTLRLRSGLRATVRMTEDFRSDTTCAGGAPMGMKVPGVGSPHPNPLPREERGNHKGELLSPTGGEDEGEGEFRTNDSACPAIARV